MIKKYGFSILCVLLLLVITVYIANRWDRIEIEQNFHSSSNHEKYMWIYTEGFKWRGLKIISSYRKYSEEFPVDSLPYYENLEYQKAVEYFNLTNKEK